MPGVCLLPDSDAATKRAFAATRLPPPGRAARRCRPRTMTGTMPRLAGRGARLAARPRPAFVASGDAGVATLRQRQLAGDGAGRLPDSYRGATWRREVGAAPFPFAWREAASRPRHQIRRNPLPATGGIDPRRRRGPTPRARASAATSSGPHGRRLRPLAGEQLACGRRRRVARHRSGTKVVIAIARRRAETAAGCRRPPSGSCVTADRPRHLGRDRRNCPEGGRGRGRAATSPRVRAAGSHGGLWDCRAASAGSSTRTTGDSASRS